MNNVQGFEFLERGEVFHDAFADSVMVAGDFV